MNDTLKKWLLYTSGGLLPLWLVETTLLPRFSLPVLPVLLPLGVAVAAVLEGALFGAQYGLVCGLFWACAYAAGVPGYIPLLTLVGMASGILSQLALRRSLSGCLLCAALSVAAVEFLRLLGALIGGLAPLGELAPVCLGEWLMSLVCAPFVYALIYFLYRRSGGKPV